MRHSCIPFLYHLFPEELQPRMIVAMNGTYGVIDSSGKTIVPFQYSNIFFSTDGKRLYTRLNKNRRAGILDLDGKQILADKYEEIGEDGDSLLYGTIKGKSSEMYTMQGKYLGRSEFELQWQCAENRRIVCRELNRGSSCGVLDRNGKVVVPLSYRSVSWAEKDWAQVWSTSQPPVSATQCLREIGV